MIRPHLGPDPGSALAPTGAEKGVASSWTIVRPTETPRIALFEGRKQNVLAGVMSRIATTIEPQPQAIY